LGIGGDVGVVEEFVWMWLVYVDVIVVSGVCEVCVVGLYDGEFDVIDRIKEVVEGVFVIDGF